MLISLLLTILGGSIGGLLALGTAWASFKRWATRRTARFLADGIAKDRATAFVLLSNNYGGAKVEWISKILTEAAGAGEGSSVLNIAGATQMDLMVSLLPKIGRLIVYDGRASMDFLDEYRPTISGNPKVEKRIGESLLCEGSFASHETFDVILAANVLHGVKVDDRQDIVRSWVKLLRPDGGRLVLIIEEDPLSEVAQAGVIQGIFHRIQVSTAKALLTSEGLHVTEIIKFPSEFLVAVLATKTSLIESS